jgi:toxin ParE1/3/4
VITIRWTEPSSADFLGIIEWISADNPPAAARVGRPILNAIEMLSSHPYLGKPGRSPDTREPGVARIPHLVVYLVEEGVIEFEPQRVVILRVLHGAMMWPPD